MILVSTRQSIRDQQVSILAVIETLFAVGLSIWIYSRLATHPVEAIRSIPENWRKIALCTDTFTAPEILPGIDDLPQDGRWGALKAQYSIEVIITHFRKGHFSLALALVFALPILLTSIAYRWSLKSTALIWSPLVWAFKPIGSNQNPLLFSKEIVELTIYKVGRFYSAVILAIFLAKLWILFLWIRIAPMLGDIPGWSVVNSYFVANNLPLWHVTAAINAILTWIIFFKAEKYMHAVKNRVPISEAAMVRFLQASFVIRNVLSVYTAACTLYITIKVGSTLQLPQMQPMLFPM